MWKQWIPENTSRRRESTTMDLRAELNRALAHGRTIDALEIYEMFEKRKPDEPRWSHRKGDLLRRIGHEADAVPPQNLVDRTIVDVSTLGVKLALPR